MCDTNKKAEVLWGYLGWSVPHIKHLRLGFYTADTFAPEPTISRDVAPILSLLNGLEPDVVSVALDPEASGPDTHYKVLQAVSTAVEHYFRACSPEKKEKLKVLFFEISENLLFKKTFLESSEKLFWKDGFWILPADLGLSQRVVPVSAVRGKQDHPGVSAHNVCHGPHVPEQFCLAERRAVSEPGGGGSILCHVEEGADGAI